MEFKERAQEPGKKVPSVHIEEPLNSNDQLPDSFKTDNLSLKKDGLYIFTLKKSIGNKSASFSKKIDVRSLPSELNKNKNLPLSRRAYSTVGALRRPFGVTADERKSLPAEIAENSEPGPEGSPLEEQGETFVTRIDSVPKALRFTAQMSPAAQFCFLKGISSHNRY